jgi:hypothetical protein
MDRNQKSEVRDQKSDGGAGFAIPESVCHWQFDELPITTRLANVVRSNGLRTLGDLKGRSSLEVLQYKSCGWLTLAEIEELIERAISGEFDEVQMEESNAPAELLTLLERGMAKLSPRERQFLLARIGGLTFAEIGRRHALTRARVQQIVPKALATLRKTAGPRIPRLLDMMKRRCSSDPAAAGLTPALLEQWSQTETVEACVSPASPRSFRLSREAQVRLIAALDKSIHCCLESPPNSERPSRAGAFGAGRKANQRNECRQMISPRITRINANRWRSHLLFYLRLLAPAAP